MEKYVSHDPSTFTTGGGLLDNVDVTVVDSKCIMFDYGGQSTVSAPGMQWTLQVDGADETLDQFWSAGSAERFGVSDDEDYLVPADGESDLGLVESSNLSILFKSLEKAGFPPAKLKEGKASNYIGMRCHIIRQAAPKGGGLTRTRKGKDGREYDQTIAVVSKIHSLPGEKAASKGKAAPTSDDAIQAEILNILGENDYSIAKKDLMPALMKIDAKLRNKAVQLASRDAWLGSGDRPWTLQDGIVSMGD